MRADRIAVVDDGEVVELGSHEELLAPRGAVRRDVRDLARHMSGGGSSTNGHGNGHVATPNGNGNGTNGGGPAH